MREGDPGERAALVECKSEIAGCAQGTGPFDDVFKSRCDLLLLPVGGLFWWPYEEAKITSIVCVNSDSPHSDLKDNTIDRVFIIRNCPRITQSKVRYAKWGDGT